MAAKVVVEPNADGAFAVGFEMSEQPYASRA
jgi:hypothetical protein